MNALKLLPPWARHILIGVGLFLAGAILAFGYSYRPLHGALSWQVDQLESRLDERNRENIQLRDTLARQNSEEATRIDPDTLAQVERELEQTQRVLNQAEKDLKRAERKRKESIASAKEWRTRYEGLRDEAAAAVKPDTTPTGVKNHAADSAIPESAPAAPAVPSNAPGRTASPGGSQERLGRGILLPKDTSGSTTP